MNNSNPHGEMLKNVVIAVEPVVKDSSSFDVFARTIRHFQDCHVLPQATIVSLIHSSLSTVPTSWYLENKNRYASEAKENIERVSLGKFDFSGIHVLRGKGSANRDLVEQMSEYLKRIQSDLLVVLASNRSGIPYWALGSFAETAALSASTPVLVIKPHAKNLKFSEKPRFTVALDAAAEYSPKHLKWLVDFALPAQARIDLISVKPDRRGILFSSRRPAHPRLADKELRKIERSLKDSGLATTLSFVKEKDSIAQMIVDFADKKQAWAVITMSIERDLSRRLLLGSTARRVLSSTKRPFVSLRLK